VSDRLTLTRALEGSGMERAAAERIATEIYGAIHDNVATKADLREPVMAGSAVDAMLRHFNLTEGSVYQRIDQAVNNHTLTPAMGEWAHEVRLDSNRPRHADRENLHVSPQQARQSGAGSLSI